MWKSKKFILVAVLAIIVLVGSTMGIVFAQNGNGDESQPKTLLDRVAKILQDEGISITSEQLKDAFAQAGKEMRDEALDRHLQRLVVAGKITEEQAGEYKTWWQARPVEQYKAWWQARPETPLPRPFGHSGFPGFGMRWGGGHRFGHGPCPPPPE